MIGHLCEMLHSGDHTLVVSSAEGIIRCFNGRGVGDLYRLLNSEPSFLSGATLADKVVGRAAAALMILGGVKEVHTDVISSLALSIFDGFGVSVSYDEEVHHIINRNHDGWCPLETRCKDCLTPEECFHRIESFINEISSK
ncbi:MAG: DUF1893 domain-containing protein [Muribaculaceae bacterium]|nr:DUF1893 domain-containing protein [Muribaculaceae bacterium]